MKPLIEMSIPFFSKHQFFHGTVDYPMSTLNLIFVGLITIFAGLTLWLTRKKQKQDLFKLRFNFYKRVRRTFCSLGYFYQLKWIYYNRDLISNYPKGSMANDCVSARERLKEFEIKIKKEFPDCYSPSSIYYQLTLSIKFLEEAEFLFDKKIRDYLEGLQPKQGGSIHSVARFDHIERAVEGKNSQLFLTFHKYLNL